MFHFLHFGILIRITGKLFIEAQGEAGAAEVVSLHYDISSISSSSANLESHTKTTLPPRPHSPVPSSVQEKKEQQNSSSSPTPSPPATPATPSAFAAMRSPPLQTNSSSPFVPPLGVLQYVYRTKTPVLLDNASQVCYNRVSVCISELIFTIKSFRKECLHTSLMCRLIRLNPYCVFQ